MAAAVENAQTETKVAGLKGFIKTNRVKAEGFVQEFRGKLEQGVADVKKVATANLDKVRALFTKSAKAAAADHSEAVNGFVDKARAAAEKAVGDGVKLTEETIAKLGLAKIADISALKDAFENLTKKLDALKKKVDGLAKGAAQDAAKPTENAAKE